MLKRARGAVPKPGNEKKLSPQEVDEWLRLFEERNRNKKYGG
jgi:hypothetical protein